MKDRAVVVGISTGNQVTDNRIHLHGDDYRYIVSFSFDEAMSSNECRRRIVCRLRKFKFRRAPKMLYSLFYKFKMGGGKRICILIGGITLNKLKSLLRIIERVNGCTNLMFNYYKQAVTA